MSEANKTVPETGTLGDGIGSSDLRGGSAEGTSATSGMSGGGATGDREQPDTVPTDR